MIYSLDRVTTHNCFRVFPFVCSVRPNNLFATISLQPYRSRLGLNTPPLDEGFH
jgi:hypothetical protein